MSEITFTQRQKVAQEMIIEWASGPMRTPFILAGYAGTGKTTLLGHIIQELGYKSHQIAYMAYTGKAAQVMMTKGMDASTIHSAIYDFEPDENFDLQMELKEDLGTVKLIVVDEASMVDADIRRDLESFGIPIIYVGDRGQLDPVGSSRGTNIMARPHINLDEIMRQEASSGIIIASQMCRQNVKVPVGQIGKDFKKFPKNEVNNIKTLNWADVVLVATNRVRKSINKRIRAHRGYEGDLPQEGERLVCLKNNRGMMINNGLTGVVVSIGETRVATFDMKFLPDGAEEPLDLVVDKETFNNDMPERPDKKRAYFDFGYALSVHKSQGSEFPNVVIVEDRMPGSNLKEHNRWLYTAVTRASRKCLLIGRGAR